MSHNENNNNTNATTMIGVAGGSAFITALVAESPFIAIFGLVASAAIVVRPVAQLCNNTAKMRREHIALQRDAVAQLEDVQSQLIELSDYNFLPESDKAVLPEVSLGNTLETINTTLNTLKK